MGNPREVLSENLTRLREQKNLTQAQMAELLTIGVRSYQAIEYRKAWPSPETLQKMAEKLDIKLADLFSEPANLTFDLSGSRPATITFPSLTKNEYQAMLNEALTPDLKPNQILLTLTGDSSEIEIKKAHVRVVETCDSRHMSYYANIDKIALERLENQRNAERALRSAGRSPIKR